MATRRETMGEVQVRVEEALRKGGVLFHTKAMRAYWRDLSGRLVTRPPSGEPVLWKMEFYVVPKHKRVLRRRKKS